MFDEKKYKIEKAEETTAILKPVFDALRIPFEYTLKPQEDTFSTETIILGEGYKLNVNGNSIRANIMVATQFLNAYFENPSGYYDGSYKDKVQGLNYIKRELK